MVCRTMSLESAAPPAPINEQVRGSREMKAKVEVESRQEADLIRRGLAEPEVRALVNIMGALAGRSDQTKWRIMRYVKGHFDEADAG